MAYRSSAIATSTAGGNITATPAGVASNDYLGGTCQCDHGSGVTITVPTSWTLRASNDQAGPDGQEMRYADKIATGSNSFQWNVGSPLDSVVINAAWSGRNTSAPRTFVQTSQSTAANTSPISIAATGGTAASGDDLALFVQLDKVTNTDSWSFGSWGNGMTERQDGQQGWVAAGLGTVDGIASGATGNLTVTATRSSGSTGAGWGAIAVSIASASVAVTGTGALTSPSSVISSSGVINKSGAGSIISSISTMLGNAIKGIPGLGSIISSSSLILGLANRGLVGSGGITSPSSSISGVATRVLLASGALISPSSQIQGFSSFAVAGPGVAGRGVEGTGVEGPRV